MSKTRIEEMLQECLDGYEAGLTPEECLSAYPANRALLAPLLRQALSLRVAYATNPSEAFRLQTRERLMFAAGRDVRLALATNPDPDFILQQRARFLNVAGAAAQEALRDVPPPRLAFWVNARRRLLEAAAATRPVPARRFGIMLRYSLSAAVVAIAIAVAALAPLGNDGSPGSPDAELAALESAITRVEQLTLQGQAVSVAELEELVNRTTQITSSPSVQDTEFAEKIGGLIVRQQEVFKQISPTQELEENQQKLAEAQQRIEGATSATPTAAAAIVVEPTEEPSPTATEEPQATATPAPLQDGEVRLSIADDDEYGLDWQRVTTDNLTFVMPSDWRLLGVERDQDGVLYQTGNFLRLDTDDETPIIILVTDSGEAITQLDGVAVQLRGQGPDADTIAAATLAQQGLVGLAIHHFVLSIETDASP